MTNTIGFLDLMAILEHDEPPRAVLSEVLGDLAKFQYDLERLEHRLIWLQERRSELRGLSAHLKEAEWWPRPRSDPPYWS